MEKDNGILLTQSLAGEEMLFLTLYEGTTNIRALAHHLFYILDGTVSILYHAKKYTLAQDDLFFIAIDEVIILSTAGSHILTFCIPPSRFRVSASAIYCNSAVIPNPHYDELRRLAAAAVHYLITCERFDWKDAAGPLRAVPSFLSRFFFLDPPPIPPPAAEQDHAADKHHIFIKDILGEINGSYTGRITLHGLAKKYYFSASYLSKLFLKETGLHFNDYIMNLRLTTALSLLIFSKYSVNEIAERSGFPDTRSLHDAFRKSRGVGPAEFRKALALNSDDPSGLKAEVARLERQGLFQNLLSKWGPVPPAADRAVSFVSDLCVDLCQIRPVAAESRFTVIIRDFHQLRSEHLRSCVRILKQDAALSALSFILPETFLPQELNEASDFLFEERLSAVFLSSPAIGGDALTRLSTHLHNRYRGKFTFEIVDSHTYLSKKTLLEPYDRKNNFVNDSCVNAVHLLHQLLSPTLSGRTEWEYLITELSDSCFPYSGEPGVFSGKSGLFTRNGIPKAAYHALRLFSQSGSHILCQKEGILVSAVPDSIRILLYTPPAEAGLQLLPGQFQSFYSSLRPVSFRIRLRSFGYSRAVITGEQLLPASCSPFEAWASAGGEQAGGLPYDMEKELAVPPLRTRQYGKAEEGCFLVQHRLLPYEICLLSIRGF